MLETQIILFTVLAYIIAAIGLYRENWVLTGLAGLLLLYVGVITSKITKMYAAYNESAWVYATFDYNDTTLMKAYFLVGIFLLLLALINMFMEWGEKRE